MGTFNEFSRLRRLGHLQFMVDAKSTERKYTKPTSTIIDLKRERNLDGKVMYRLT